MFCFFFFFNDTATTEIYTLSLHDALPICTWGNRKRPHHPRQRPRKAYVIMTRGWNGSTSISAGDRKSTRLNSSHVRISYAVFCLKKKKRGNSFTQSTTPCLPGAMSAGSWG